MAELRDKLTDPSLSYKDLNQIHTDDPPCSLKSYLAG